ncbi:flavocytochrome c [Desulfobacterales bacterium HSG16]|nr:flavocytochrome c [Desulfobacterales bacterium HSG16]
MVGSGAAGLSAAVEAKEAGANVIVFEKMKVTGGNTRLSDGGLAGPGNFLQKSRGIEDSQQLFYEDMIKAGMGLNHPHLVKIVAQKASETIDWTIKNLGLEYKTRLDRFGGHCAARCITTKNHTGADITKAQTKKLDRIGVPIRTNCLMTRLITDSTGAVQGIQIKEGFKFGEAESGTIKNIKADHAVILASGGFGNDIRFRTLQNPVLDESIGSTNHRGATAEGLIAALKINAASVHLSCIQTGPWGCADETGYGRGASFASYSVYPFGILIDPATGSRIVNEWADRKQRCDAIFKTGHICIGIVDARGAEKAAFSLQSCLKSGKIKAFEKLSDIAMEYKMPPDKLESTVKAYNLMIKNKEQDEFGKLLQQDSAQLLEKSPFYTVRLWPKVHYTSGGLGINANAQVIDLDGQPIPGLFAAGEVCGGIHGASRLGSCALTECIVFGRIAGQQAVKKRLVVK